MKLRIGTAGWAIPKEFSTAFPGEGSALVRYSRIFNAVEINSSFYRDHKDSTYHKWASLVPTDFRFSIKLSKAYTHECGLKPKSKDLSKTLNGITGLEDKLGMLLVQFPGKLEFDHKNAEKFFQLIRKYYAGPIALEPRNLSWASKEARSLMRDLNLTKVSADPEKCAVSDSRFIKSGKHRYYRLHGSPIIYRSSYENEFLQELKTQWQGSKQEIWCIFDNTTFGQATANALFLKSL